MTLDVLDRARGVSKEQKLINYVLFLARLVAKVTYNAAEPADQFPPESGWWIGVSLKSLADNYWPEEQFAKAAWAALTWSPSESSDD